MFVGRSAPASERRADDRLRGQVEDGVGPVGARERAQALGVAQVALVSSTTSPSISSRARPRAGRSRAVEADDLLAVLEQDLGQPGSGKPPRRP